VNGALCRSLRESGLLAYFAPRAAYLTKSRNRVGVGVHLWPSESLAPRLGIPKPGFHALNDQAAFQFRHGAQDARLRC
jgi:hypothetical protein